MIVEEIFALALEKPAGTEREAFLTGVLDAHPELRDQVLGLVRAHESAGSFLAAPYGEMKAGQGVESGSPIPAFRAGQQVGSYSLVRQLGSGGMGVVWLAAQREPVERNVALKIIQAGMDSQSVLARFAAERHALERMEHPNIAKILDAGRTPDGRPFFVMELVVGTPITGYCDERRLDVRDRLRLFAEVCAAVQHAHQKGIIHRDIKPSNVLVADESSGAPGQVKVIDFGIAKAIREPLTDKTAFTQLGQVVGTLEYMSPEQADFQRQDVDTRSDVYSLGVLLYELLTGSRPVDRQQLHEAAFDEMLRVIREVDPPRPSDRLRMTDTLPSVAALRDVPPSRLSRVLRGDLDWVVMKALEKDRERRYSSAAAFAQDVYQYLNDEPVSAGPPSRWYRTKKFLRRNRGAAIASALVLSALLLGMIGTAWGMIRASRALIAEAEERKQAEEVAQLLESTFGSIDPMSTESDPRLQMISRLRQAAFDLEKSYGGKPLIRARMYHVLGMTLLGLGEKADAVRLLELAANERARLLGDDHVDTLQSVNSWGYALVQVDKPAEALVQFRAAHERRAAVLGADHPDTLRSMCNIATTLFILGERDKAKTVYKELMQRNEKTNRLRDTDYLQLLVMVSSDYLHAGKIEDAGNVLQQVVDGMTELYGQNHPAVLDAVDNLAFHFRLVGDHERALPLFVAEAAGRKIRQGPTDKSTIDALYYVADTMSKLERRVDEEQVWTELVSIKRVSQPPDVKLLAGYLARLGKCQLLLQKFPAAETNLRESLALYLTQQSQEARTAQVKSLLGEALVKLERYDEAESLLIDACTALAEHKSQLAEEDRESQLRRSVERIIELYQRWGRPDDVKKWSMKLRPADTNPGFQEKETGKILSAG